MYTVYLPTVGEVRLHFATLFVLGSKLYISGYDEDHNRVDLILDKLVYPDDQPDDCGYCHIISYTTQGNTVPCGVYRPIH